MTKVNKGHADGNYVIGHGPKLPVNQAQFDEIRREIRAAIGGPGLAEALEHWEGPNTGLDISVEGTEVSIRVASTHHIDTAGNVVKN